MRNLLFISVFLLALILKPQAGIGSAAGSAVALPSDRIYGYTGAKSLIGQRYRHTITRGETLLDVARQYDLGFNEIQDLYPQWDPWLPPVGETLQIPSVWIIPESVNQGIVINIAELRLFYFDKKKNTIETFPIGIGDIDWTTPEGTFKIEDKEVGPVWNIPPSLREKYGVKTIPPGPDNPLGEYWMRLGSTHYGIHGTNIPWSIGRLVTHGCIRLYPEDIGRLFKLVEPGTLVKIIYEPVKFGIHSGRIYAEVHRDIYGKIGDLYSYGHFRLHDQRLFHRVDIEAFRKALKRRDGMPVDVTR